jgi:hypothetical protein
MKCTCCRNNESVLGRKRCQICADRHNLALRTKRANRIKDLTCSDCGKPSATRRCPSCRELHNLSAKDRRRRLADSSLCMNCGQQLEHKQGRRCTTCAESHCNKTTAQRLERIASGKCIRCGNESATNAQRCAACSVVHNAKCTGRDKSRKLDAFNAYGGPRCNCCGDSIFQFLTIDHINNDGAAHRKLISKDGRSGGALNCWLKRHGYPPGFQVLCFNCNIGKHINGGICPHKVLNVQSNP